MTEQERKFYAALGGENIKSSSAKALALAQELRETVLLKTHKLEIPVEPEDDIDSIVARVRAQISAGEVRNSTSELSPSKGAPEDWKAYEQHIEALEALDTVNIGSLLEWFERLYELQSKIYIEDKKYGQRITDILRARGYIPGYGISPEMFNVLEGDTKILQWIIGDFLRTLTEDGIIRHATMTQLEKYKGYFQGARFQPREEVQSK